MVSTRRKQVAQGSTASQVRNSFRTRGIDLLSPSLVEKGKDGDGNGGGEGGGAVEVWEAPPGEPRHPVHFPSGQ